MVGVFYRSVSVDQVGLGVRANEVSATDQSPILQVITWLLLAIVTLLLGFRQLTRFYIKAGKPFGWDDGLMIGSYVFGIGENLTILLPAGRAIGKEMMDISKADLIVSEKASYARDLLFIVCVGLSKLSVATSLLSLSPDGGHRRLMRGLQLSIAAWMLSSILGVAFQCGARGPWDTNMAQCSSRRGILTYIAIANILTDVALLCIPITTISPLKMRLNVKLTVLSFYMIRIFVVAATIIQLVYLPQLFAENYTLRSFPYYLSMQLVLFLSMTASCAVYFWPLFRSLQSGFMLAKGPDLARPHTTVAATKGSSFKTTQDSSTSRHNRSGYIEITTDIDIQHGQPPKRDDTAINAYAWELQQLEQVKLGNRRGDGDV